MKKFGNQKIFVKHKHELLAIKDPKLKKIKQENPTISNKQAVRIWDKFYYPLRKMYAKGFKITIDNRKGKQK